MLRKSLLVTGVYWATLALFICMLSVPAGAWAGRPSLGAKAAALIDVTTGEMLYEKNGHQRLPMASTTKIMTAILALERGDLDEIVSVSDSAARTEGSSLYIRAGERYPLRDLVYGLMLRSGNDAAEAIAEHLAGGIRQFARWMTDKARQIGADNTRFSNPHGLPAANHYTTAVDLAKITAYALRVPGFLQVVGAKTAAITWPGHQTKRTIINRNKLLWEYDGATGVKTGYTRAAGRCFVGSARRGDRHLVAVVLNSPAIWEETMALLDYGFGRFRLVFAARRGEEVATIPVKGGLRDKVKVVAGDDLPVSVPEAEVGEVKRRLTMAKTLTAPIIRWQKVGTLTVLVDGKEIARTDLLAANAVRVKTWLDRVKELIGLKN